MTFIVRDLIFTLRLLRRQPGTTFLVLAMLVLGVAGTACCTSCCRRKGACS